jgi:uncharacterized protein
MMTMSDATYILTHTGRHFEFADPVDIDIRDIAHALANLCRFTGHTTQFYSVAQHSVLVSMLCPGRLKLAGLLHDASEAYLGDVSIPLKSLLPDYRAIERRVQGAILRHFNLPDEYPLEVKAADMRMLATERARFMPDDIPWPCLNGVTPLPEPLDAWGPAKAGEEFLSRFSMLTEDSSCEIVK